MEVNTITYYKEKNIGVKLRVLARKLHKDRHRRGWDRNRWRGGTQDKFEVGVTVGILLGRCVTSDPKLYGVKQHSFYLFVYLFMYLCIYGHTHSPWKFLAQGSNPSHS